MKGTRETTITTMKRVRRKKWKERETDPRLNIMFRFNETEVVLSKVKAAGYDKLLASKVEGRVSSHEAMDNADLDSKDPCSKAWDMMW